jgi:hypothetical protein
VCFRFAKDHRKKVPRQSFLAGVLHRTSGGDTPGVARRLFERVLKATAGILNLALDFVGRAVEI